MQYSQTTQNRNLFGQISQQLCDQRKGSRSPACATVQATRTRPRWHVGAFLPHKTFVSGLRKLIANEVFLATEIWGFVIPCHTYFLIFYNKSNNVNSSHKPSGFSASKLEREVQRLLALCWDSATQYFLMCQYLQRKGGSSVLQNNNQANCLLCLGFKRKSLAVTYLKALQPFSLPLSTDSCLQAN